MGSAIFSAHLQRDNSLSWNGSITLVLVFLLNAEIVECFKPYSTDWYLYVQKMVERYVERRVLYRAEGAMKLVTIS